MIWQPVIDQWRREKKQAADQAAKTAHDAAIAQQIADKKKADEAARLLALQQSGDKCDEAAANPSDARRPSSIAGVEYNNLKSNANVTADLCETAVKLHPEEPRYRYNWARALEFINPQR